MSQLLSLSNRAGIITKVFKDNRDRLLRLAPKTSGDPGRLLSIAYATIAYDSDLVQCTPESLFGGVVEALKLGITLGGPMQEGWLIPFKVQGKLTATLIVGYQGYRNIIDRAGSVIDMHPRAVHVLDGQDPGAFDYWYGDQPRIIHRSRHPQPTKEDELYAVYCIANLRRGGRQMEVMLKEEVDAHRARSRAASSGRSPWTTDYVPMALKTVVRKMSKYLPKSNELLARALQLDEQADLGQPQQFDVEGLVIPTEDDLQAQPTTGGSAMEKLKASKGAPQAPASTVAAEPPAADDIKWND